MPKTVPGIYVKAERSIIKLIALLNTESKGAIIIKEIDEYSCIISPKKEIIMKVSEEIEKCQNKYLFDDQHFEK